MSRKWISMSSTEIVRELGGRFRNLRLMASMSQQEVSRRANVSVVTISRFENGMCSDISLLTIISLLRAVRGLDSIGELIPDVSESPYFEPERKRVGKTNV